MRARPTAAAALLLIALLSAAACGGEPETVTVTETVTETVVPEGPDDRAYALAEDICRSVPRALVAPFLGADATDEDQLADAFSRIARPELREAARDGCRAGLEPN